MNLYIGLVCSAGVLFNSSEPGFDVLLLHNNAGQRNLKKRLLIPILHTFACLVSIAQQNVNSAANVVFISKTGLPRVVLVLRWVLLVPEIFVSLLSEFEQHVYSSDAMPDTGSLMQLESRRAVPQASQPQ